MRREDAKSKKVSKGMDTSKFVQKQKASFKSRYQGELAPEKDIVEGFKTPSYKSRYK